MSAVFTSPFFYAVILGLLLGSAELMGRYREDPLGIFFCRYAWLYIGINGALAAISLYLIRVLGLNFTPTETPPNAAAAPVYDVIMAGFGGAAFFRSSVMKTKASDTDVSIGPAIVLDTLLKVTDRQVDRYLASRRATVIAELMKDVNLAQTVELVIPFCISLMQNTSAAEREELTEKTKEEAETLVKVNPTNKTKTLQLGLATAGMVGFDVLQIAINALRIQGILPQPKTTEEQDEIQATLDAAWADDDGP